MNMIEVTWEWPSGEKAKMMVPKPVLPEVYKVLRNKNLYGDLKFDGLDYRTYIKKFGGVVVEGVGVFDNPFWSTPWPYLIGLLLVGGAITAYIFLGKKKKTSVTKPTTGPLKPPTAPTLPVVVPESESAAVALIKEEKHLPAGTNYVCRVMLPSLAMPLKVRATPSGFEVKSYSRGNYNYWFWVPTQSSSGSSSGGA